MTPGSNLTTFSQCNKTPLVIPDLSENRIISTCSVVVPLPPSRLSILTLTLTRPESSYSAASSPLVPSLPSPVFSEVLLDLVPLGLLLKLMRALSRQSPLAFPLTLPPVQRFLSPLKPVSCRLSIALLIHLFTPLFPSSCLRIPPSRLHIASPNLSLALGCLLQWDLPKPLL